MAHCATAAAYAAVAEDLNEQHDFLLLQAPARTRVGQSFCDVRHASKPRLKNCATRRSGRRRLKATWPSTVCTRRTPMPRDWPRKLCSSSARPFSGCLMGKSSRWDPGGPCRCRGCWRPSDSAASCTNGLGRRSISRQQTPYWPSWPHRLGEEGLHARLCPGVWKASDNHHARRAAGEMMPRVTAHSCGCHGK